MLDNLGNLEDRIKAAIAAQDDKRSSLQLVQRIKDLEEVKSNLQSVRKEQSAAKKTAARDLPAASELGQKAVKGIDGIGADKDLPPVVSSRLREADSAVKEAARSLVAAAKSAAASTRPGDDVVSRHAVPSGDPSNSIRPSFHGQGSSRTSSTTRSLCM